MRLFYDTEFIEDGRTIDLISIGMVSDDDRKYYAVNRDMPVKRIARHEWLMANVVPGLPRLHGDARMLAPRRDKLLLDWHHPDVKPRRQIIYEVESFISSIPDVKLWAWYGSYDHVVLAQLFGPMVMLPERIPKHTNDLKQECDRLGNPSLPRQTDRQHDAFADAKHNRVIAHFLDEIEQERAA